MSMLALVAADLTAADFAAAAEMKAAASPRGPVAHAMAQAAFSLDPSFFKSVAVLHGAKHARHAVLDVVASPRMNLIVS